VNLSSNRIDPVNKVVITTIQRLYSILKGEPEFDAALEEDPLPLTPEGSIQQSPSKIQEGKRLHVIFTQRLNAIIQQDLDIQENVPDHPLVNYC
jgi:hypothetical protein